MSWRVVIAALLGLVAVAPTAQANPIDLFGASPRTSAMGGAAVALFPDGTSDSAAAYHNPALAAEGRGATFQVSYRRAVSTFQLNGRAIDHDDARGTLFGFSLAHRITDSVRGGFSALVYFPDQTVIRVRIAPDSRPRFALFENRPHRVSADLGYSLKLPYGLSVGGGLTILGHATGRGIEVALRPDLGALEDPDAHQASVDIEVTLPMSAAPTAGITWQPPTLPELRLGVGYRGALSFDIGIGTALELDAGFITGDALVLATQSIYYTPARASVGASYYIAPRLLLAAQLDYVRWSGYRDAVSEIELNLNLGISFEPPAGTPNSAATRFGDIVIPRLGAEYRVLERGRQFLALRGGYHYAPTPVPEQTGLTNLLDTDRHVLSVGVGGAFEVGEILPEGVTFSIDLQLHEMSHRSTQKASLDLPYPDLEIDGRILHIGAQLGVRL